MSKAGHYRMGRFRVSDSLIWDNHPDYMRPLMQEVVIIECTHSYDTQCFNYLALCERFEELAPGEEAPWYEFTFVKEDFRPARIMAVVRLREPKVPVAPTRSRIRRIVEQA